MPSQAELQCSEEFNGKKYLRFVYPSLCEHPENPLSLLGQYSDDELDDVSYKAEGELQDSRQAIESISKHLEEGELEDPSCQKADDEYRQSDSASASACHVVDADRCMNKMVTSDEKNHEVVGDRQDLAALPVDIQSSGDIISSWKMVLHEESSRYYYWNTVTGETSWEVPEVLVHSTAFADGLETSRKDLEESASVDVYNATAAGVGVDGFSAGRVSYTNGVSQMKMVYEQVYPESQSGEQSKGDNNQLLVSSLVAGAMPCETAAVANFVFPEQYNGVVRSLTLNSYVVHGHSVGSTEQSTHLPSHLVNQSETLLEKVKLLQGSGIDPDRHGLLSRYMAEIELRLSDIRALLPHGSSLLPFWMHTEGQLNQLENSINSGIGESDIKTSGTCTNSSGENNVQSKDTGNDTKVDTTLTKLSPEIDSAIAKDKDALLEAPKSSQDQICYGGSLNLAETSVSDPTTHANSNIEGGTGVSNSSLYEKSNSKPESLADDDIDMDIDMEVEAPSPARKRSADTGGQLEDPSMLYVQPSTSVVGESLVPESEFVIPPPPEEDWIPPPPPDDDEGIPPPPSDEPPESLCPPLPPFGPDAADAIYGGLYNMNYPESNLYFENASAVSSRSIFSEHVDSSQTTALNFPVCFDSAQLPIAVPNPSDAELFYVLPNGSLSDVSLADTTLPDALLGVCSLPKQIVYPLATSATPGIFSSQASSMSVVSALATVSVKQHDSVPSSNSVETAASASEASATVSKAPIKAPRMKKPKVSVGSSLRSNKKVSSLVDKWKAAKEELEEVEEQYETPLEILEKKRQREIEDWRAQQIASGEAKENANFQPLGGNWRERVKRRRAQKGAATEIPSDTINEGIKQPDLKALSKDLPLGWQVFWDDSSSQFYYSNSITSETTWTRPT